MKDSLEAGSAKPPRLLVQVREAIRRRNYSYRTEEAYVQWIRRFIYFSAKRHPLELGAAEVTAFLNHLARERDVAAATQNQALSALPFLYKEVLKQPLPWLDELERAKRPARLPTVLSRAEVTRLLGAMQGTKWLMASLLYGAGLRLTECLKLRVKDIDFAYRQIMVRDGKAAKDRMTMLPLSTVQPLKRQLAVAKAARWTGRRLFRRRDRGRGRYCSCAGRRMRRRSVTSVSACSQSSASRPGVNPRFSAR
jgi:site-specific recombinase XerD